MAFLAYLAIAAPRGLHRRDKLLALFWPELDQAHARNALSQALHIIRAALGNQAVVTYGDEEVGIDATVVHADVIEFESALDEGRLEEGLALYRGELLDGHFITGAPEFEHWLDLERARLRQRAADAAWRLACTHANNGASIDASKWARWSCELLPPDEIQLRRLMVFLRELGDRPAALRAYEQFADAFAKEYELLPSEETRQLAETIRNDIGAAPKPAKSSPDSRTILGHSSAPVFQDSNVPVMETAGAPANHSRGGVRRRSLAAVTVLLVISIAAGFAFKSRTMRTSDEPRIQRLVVMPFQNLGAPENSYFADGIADEITTRLATFRGLHVIGGAAARSYMPASSARKDESNADYFLEGSASWLPSTNGRGRIRVRLQLANARDSRELWGAAFDEEITEATEIFALYASIAQRVINELNLVLESPRTVPAGIPTRNLEAYNDYLRGRDYLRRTSAAINFEAAIENLERAVQLDSTFALAYALLGNAHTEGVWQGGLNRAHLDSARMAQERSLELAPDLPEGHTSLGFYYYACCEDYERALWHLTKSHAMRPGDYQIVMYIGNVYKREGHFAEAMDRYKEAAQLDPLARWPRNNLGHAQMWVRQFDEAQKTFESVIASEPQDIFAYAHLAWLLVLRDGDTKAASRIIEQARAASDGFAEMRLPYYLALLNRDYPRALAQLRPPEPGLTNSLLNEWLVDDEIRRAVVLRLLKDTLAAKLQFDSARMEIEAALHGSPPSRRDQLWLRSGLAIADAGLRRTEQAKQQIDFVTSSNPLRVDAIEGPKYLQHVALAEVLLGKDEAAITVLAQLLEANGPVTRESLRLEPFWDPLRRNARFARLVGTQ